MRSLDWCILDVSMNEQIVFTQSQEIQKTKDTAAMLVHKTKGDQKIPLLRQ